MAGREQKTEVCVLGLFCKKENGISLNPIIWEQPAHSGSGKWIRLFNEPSGVTFAMIQEARPT